MKRTIIISLVILFSFVAKIHAGCFPVPAFWGFAIACTLDTGGTATETYTCSADSVQGSSDEGYKIIGKCTHWIADLGEKVYYFKAAASLFYNAPYQKYEVKESVAVYKDANRPEKIGELSGEFSCSKNPLSNFGVSCTTVAFNNNTGVNILNYRLPLTGGLAADSSKTGTSQQALTEANNIPYIGV